MKTYNVVIIGFAHMHINDVAQHFYEHPATNLVACADTIPAVPELRTAPYTRTWNKSFCMENYKIPRSYDNYLEMLDQEKPDLAIVTSENIKHREIVEQCAVRGINVCVEKPMAISLADALAMKRVCEQNGVTLMINWPITWMPEYFCMKKVLDSGVIGRVLEFKIRTSHTGPLGDGAQHKGVAEKAQPMTGEEKAATWWHRLSQGGGSMYDFCCYGSILSHWLLDQEAISVFGMRANLNSQFGDADDNAIMVIRYPEAIATIETSWTTPQELMPPNMPLIYGTKGAMTIEPFEGVSKVKVVLDNGMVQYFSPEDPDEQFRDVACSFVQYMNTGCELHPTQLIDKNISAMRILDAGARSATSHKMEICNSAYWQIG